MAKGVASPVAIVMGGGLPSTSGGGLFTGATIPLTYKDNTTEYENNYTYKSTYDITITGLDTRATITGNGSKEVLVEFDVTSATSSLKNFTITLTNETETYEFKGMHAHYGVTVSGILTLAYNNITPDGSEGTIGTNYIFIESTSTDLPYFSSTTTLWNGIYSHQGLNTLVSNFSSTSIGDYFLRECYSFNQPLTIPSSVTSIGAYFLYNCNAFNQPLTIPSSVTSIGAFFLYSCFSLSTIIYESSTYPTDSNALAQTSNTKTDQINGSGIIVYGTNRTGLLTALPNSTSSPYRYLIDGGF